ncbi:ATP-binding protein [Flammeovirgaceae bacterium SG7u.111]|nr:ATP-binding protein [Flammeovirgaceae bacterium SG7u.132]WPO38128.1 ATP-binding protein [Flammeovirgaceae bacterium SG7u.111]
MEHLANKAFKSINNLLTCKDEQGAIGIFEGALKTIFNIEAFSLVKVNSNKEFSTVCSHATDINFPKLLQKATKEKDTELKLPGSFTYIQAQSQLDFFIFYTTKKGISEANSIGEVIKALLQSYVNSPANRPNEENLKAKANILSTVSHEIRTPINGILGLSNLLLKNDPRKDQIKLLSALRSSGENLRNLVNDVLDFSKIQSGKVVFEHIPFSLYEFLKRTELIYKIQAMEKGIKLNFQISDKVTDQVYGDPTRLSQIFNNLLSNALKFTESGSVTLQVDEPDCADDGKYKLFFQVKDTGIGIPKGQYKKIFEAFSQAGKDTTRRFGGTGLGLAIVQQLVHLMKGEISLKSELGIGTTFNVQLPFEKVQTNDEDLQSASIASASILYVDDVTINHMLLQGYTSSWNIDLETATSGLEAIEKISGKKYDLILMDLKMPGMDGFETTRRIREMELGFTQDLPILALTAEITDEEIFKMQASGFSSHFLKPFRPDALKLMIAKWLKENVSNPTTNKNLCQTNIYKKQVDFSKIEKLCAYKESAVIRLLENSIIDLEEHRNKLLDAINKNNTANYSRAFKQICPLLEMLHQKELIDLLAQLNKLMSKELHSTAKEVITKSILDSFNKLNQEIDLKLEMMSI